eukprot:10422538-Alexandrium_andersonii.AAC.1
MAGDGSESTSDRSVGCLGGWTGEARDASWVFVARPTRGGLRCHCAWAHHLAVLDEPRGEG